MALKARICATLGVADYPEKGSRLKDAFRTHDFDDLKLLAGMDRSFTANANLLANWSVASKWKPERRYKPAGTYNKSTALQILDSVRGQPDGVLQCISLNW